MKGRDRRVEDILLFTFSLCSGLQSFLNLLMQQVLNTGKRVFSAAVAAATIAFSVGAGVLVSPASVSAASAGDLIKGTSFSAVYYYGYDGMRYVFPNETTFMTWFSDFNGVKTVSDSALSDITLGSSNVVMRPGSWWIKVQSDAKVYAVARDGMIHWIESADVAEDLAGSDWNKRIVDVADVFFADYSVGTSLMEATAYEGALYNADGKTYLSWDGEMREVTSAGMSANGLMSKFVLDGANVDDSDLSAGDAVSSKLTSLVDVAQTEEDAAANSGDVTVSEASAMPRGRTLTKGANGVEVFSFDVEAGNEDAMLDGVVLSLTGAGDASNVESVYLYEGDTRLTEARSVNSSTREVTFNSLDVAIDAGESVTLTAKVTVATGADAASTFGFELESADMVSTSGDVDGDFPVSGDEFTIGGGDSGTVTITRSGTISDVAIGSKEAEIAEFKIEADGEDADVELITLEVQDAADHSNFVLWDGSEKLVTCENTTADQVVCDLSDEAFAIEEGDSNIFTLTADVGGRADDEIKVFVDNAIDVVAIGGDFGFGMTTDISDAGNYDGSSCEASDDNCSYSVIEGGDVTIAFNGPSAGDIQVDAQDQELLNFSITSAEDITVKSMDITIESSAALVDGADALLTNVEVVDAKTGRTVGASLELSDEDMSETLTFTDDFTVDAGETLDLSVRATVEDVVVSGTTFSATLETSSLDIEDANGDTLATSSIVPSSDIVGYDQTARAASLAIALASTPVDSTTVQGTDNHAVAGFTFTAGDASSVKVTDVTLSVYGNNVDNDAFTLGGETSADVNDFIESCSLYDGSTLVGGPEAPTSSGEYVEFDRMDWMLNASEVATLTVKCNFANPSETDDADFSFDIDNASADVVAYDQKGDTLDASGTDVNGAGTPSTVVTVAESGSFAVAVAAAMPDADIIVTDSEALVAVYRFTATNEDYTIKTLTFSEEQAEDDRASANSNAYANNISSVRLSWTGMASGTDVSATMSGNEARFSGLSIPVSATKPTDVKVMVTIPGTDRVSGGSATSNEKIRMGLFVDTTGDDNFKAVGVGSGVTLDDDDMSAIGDDRTDGVPTFVVKESYLAIARSSASPVSAVASGRAEVLRFNVSAAPGEDVVLNSMIFKLSASDVASEGWLWCSAQDAADFDIYNRADMNSALDVDGSWTLLLADGSECDGEDENVAFVQVEFADPEVIAANQTETYSLNVDVTGADTDDSIFVEVATDPIVSAYLSSGTTANANATIAADTVSVADSDPFMAGDLIKIGSEVMLVTSVDGDADDLTVVRGYLNTATAAVTSGTAVSRLPSSLFWKDDGVSGDAGATADDFWGSYLVDITDFSGASGVQF